MSIGYGVGAGVGIGTETTPGTPVAPGVWLPFTTESLAGQRSLVEDGTIYGDRSVKTRLYGPRSAGGGIQMLVDGSNVGLPFYCWNGNAAGAYSVVPLGGFVTTAPTASPENGGDLPLGQYRYKVASVWQRTRDGALSIMPSSAEQTATAAGSDQSVELSWTSPGSLNPLSGYSYAGTAIFRSEVGGSADTLRLIHYVAGSGSSYTDDGGKPRIMNVSPYTAVPYLHTYVKSFVPGQNPLPAFTTTVVKDNDVAERYALCRMNTFELSVGGADAPVQMNFEVLARDYDTVPNPVISHTVLRKMMGWQSQVEINGEFSPVVESVSFSGSNGAELVPGLRGVAGFRDVGYGQRSITGSFARGFEDHQFFHAMRNGCRFNVRTDCFGQHFADAGCNIENSELVAYPFTYALIAEAFQCSLSQAGGNVGGFGRIQETVNWEAETDPASGTDFRLRLINLTAGPYS